MTDILSTKMLDQSYPIAGKHNDIRYYEERLSSRKDKEREEQEMNQFLHNSLRASDRLHALERSKKINYKMNAGFEADNVETELIGGRMDIDVGRFTEALCNRKYNKAKLSRSELDWLQRYVQSDSFQVPYKFSLAIEEILARYEHPPLMGSTKAIQYMRKIVTSLSAAQDQSRDSPHKYQMQELLQLLSGPDLQALLYANDECAHNAISTDEHRMAENNAIYEPEPLSSKVIIAAKPNQKMLPIVPRQAVAKNDEDSVRIIRSPLPGCYAQIHSSDRNIPLKTVVLEKGKHPLGATVRNERDAVVVGRIVVGGIAYKSGLLKEGDELLSVNDLELTGKDVNEVSDILARMSGTLRFTVASISDGINRSLANAQPNTTIHLKALFTYKPEDDIYMPCIDIGLPFDRGDVLHVTNVQDPNWWQAYRDDDGRDSGSLGGLAGLIPSPDYQYQREMLRKQLNGHDPAMAMYASIRQQSSILCLKKARKKNPSSVNGGWVYNVDVDRKISTVDNNRRRANKKNRSTYCPADLEFNQLDPNINTYEEVQMFIPQPHRKRPIVLVGPELIGRHDLVNRIISTDPDLFSLLKKHTTLESRTAEYRYVSKEEFRHLQNQEEFIETATFEKNWYGYGKSELKAVIDQGKTAVFVLQPESLRQIRKTSFLPYVIFMRPPTNIEQLRALRIQLDNQRPPDDELITTIGRANAIDTMFGQFFDTVLTVTSLDTAVEQALKIIRSLDRDPQWVPSRWLGQRPLSHMGQ